MKLISAILLGLLLSAQERTGSGLTPPQLIFKVEPEFSAEARAAGVQGTVVLDLIVSPRGRAENIQIVSPLGFGLDEKAVAAVLQWQFRPGEKNGQPVNVAATVDVNFRFAGEHFDSKLEQRRIAYNRAVSTLSGKARGKPQDAINSLTDLAGKKFPPAVYALGVLLQEGTHVPKDAGKALALFRESAAKHHGPAMYEIGKRTLTGSDGIEKDEKAGLRMLKDAAILGSEGAQFLLGEMYRTGSTGVEHDQERARHYYRLCAAGGVPRCQFRLAGLLLEARPREERAVVQAIAWCQLATAGGDGEAKELLAAEEPKLTAKQLASVASLKKRLIADR